MKSHTRRIWIFIGLKLKGIGIVLVWSIFGLFMGFWPIIFNASAGLAISYYGITLSGIIFAVAYEKIKKWIKSNWRKAGQIERKTRKK